MADTEALKEYATQQADIYGIPPNIFLNLISAESSWNPNAVSSKGAEGIAQLMPGTAPEIDRFDPFASITKAAQLLSDYFSQFGNWNSAVAAYNAGPGAVAQYGGVPPYKETEDYVSKIIGGSLTPSGGTSGSETGTIAPGVFRVFFWASVIIVGVILLKAVGK